ncbi:hypothetical protein YPPY94_2193 [Yersinia pestis PY-94]|uniref:Uncharacterized protein n=1 Tax=Yersinia pestis PY-08 TaxID=992134 RepID=A0AB72ZJP0_YERPE|nr:hypothetical protein YPPY01_2116 [Yersinia pestis PY-01]EIR19278.1 hypothetical protein YPPY08_2198 [Yersinia pestis PY-08]EIR27259.1 hypothetical protein YPPY09_0120 [Yersinia pestis PY-09]EIR65515.1 hypothetical protein YPPY25_2205 [Yersinia pestis PY-25]EIR78399.1 hypothetical protein YPPY32_2460 [Yersinia pestis PY-32]EIS43667.1 hypothetical protein YPPY58_2223 [Yersinia pestis PY-58]EIS77313.1 hypothetical protein YPPY71_2083 [Yersinia pestis PY-71]EIS84387.1 hypothetical protein YPP
MKVTMSEDKNSIRNIYYHLIKDEHIETSLCYGTIGTLHIN